MARMLILAAAVLASGCMTTGSMPSDYATEEELCAAASSRFSAASDAYQNWNEAQQGPSVRQLPRFIRAERQYEAWRAVEQHCADKGLL